MFYANARFVSLLTFSFLAPCLQAAPLEGPKVPIIVRQDYLTAPPNCNLTAPSEPANAVDVGEAVRFLNRTSSCYCAAHDCEIVSCANTGAIYLCNDNDYEIWPQCDYLAGMASGIEIGCLFYDGSLNQISTGGQLYDWGNFSVTVQQGQC